MNVNKILNNKIIRYNYMRVSELINFICDNYYNDNIFLSHKFYDDFKDNFKVDYNKFESFIEDNNLYNWFDIVNVFFCYQNDWDTFIMNNRSA